MSFAFISVLESSPTLRTPSSWKRAKRYTVGPFLKFCSTEPLSLGLKNLAHVLLFLGLNFSLACPTDTSAQQAGVANGVLNDKFYLGCLNFSPGNTVVPEGVAPMNALCVVSRYAMACWHSADSVRNHWLRANSFLAASIR